MALMHSNELELGTTCPTFSLPSVDGRTYELRDFAESKALLIAFICNHCPYVRAIEDRLIALKRAFKTSELEMVGICSNDASRYPDDSKEQLFARWQEKNYGFPYLIDEDQSVARAFSAVCTPDLFLFDQNRALFYHGQLDDNWQQPQNVKKEDMKDAIRLLLNDQDPPVVQKPSMGCSIKWK